jgi:hypothetical protein
MRSTRHAIEVSEEMREMGIDLIFTAQNIDTTTASGRLYFNIIAAFAEHERDTISERVSEGIQRRLSQGGKWGKGRRKDINLGIVEELLKSKKFHTVQEVADALKIPRTTLLDHVRWAGRHFSESTYYQGMRLEPPADVRDGDGKEFGSSVAGHEAADERPSVIRRPDQDDGIAEPKKEGAV